MQLRRLRIFTLASFVIGTLLFAVPALASDYGLKATAGAAGIDTTVGDIPTIIGNIIGTGLSLVGIAFFILTIYGGFLWMTAHGNDDQIKRALKIITAAIIGLIIVMASFAITNFVFNSLGTNSGGSPAAAPPAAPGSGGSAPPPPVNASTEYCCSYDIAGRGPASRPVYVQGQCAAICANSTQNSNCLEGNAVPLGTCPTTSP